MKHMDLALSAIMSLQDAETSSLWNLNNKSLYLHNALVSIALLHQWDPSKYHVRQKDVYYTYFFQIKKKNKWDRMVMWFAYGQRGSGKIEMWMKASELQI